MAKGQFTFLQLCNRVLLRLGKAQVATLQSVTTDSWADIVKAFVNDAQQSIYKEHDWSTLKTTYTISANSNRTYDMSTNISDFGREIDLVDTTNGQLMEPCSQREIDFQDPELDDAGSPIKYTIDYPNLLFAQTPASITYRLRYLKRPTTLSANADVSLLPEWCDMAIVWWAVWQLYATREDSADGGQNAKAIYEQELARAIGQDRRRTDRLWRMQPFNPASATSVLVPFPRSYQGY